MFIVSKKRDSVINANSVECIYVGDDAAVKAVCSTTGKMYRIGQYSTNNEAVIALEMLVNATTKNGVLMMPDDNAIEAEIRKKYPERPDKFAGNGKKTVRRGGS